VHWTQNNKASSITCYCPFLRKVRQQDISNSLVEMWKCSLQQVGHKLLHVGHVLYGCNVWSQWHSYPVHLHQTEHVCQDGRMHHQTYTVTPSQYDNFTTYKLSNHLLQLIRKQFYTSVKILPHISTYSAVQLRAK